MCPCCKNKIEDVQHFIFECPLYVDYRKRFASQSVSLHILLNNYSVDKYRYLSKYIHYAIAKRQKFIEIT